MPATPILRTSWISTAGARPTPNMPLINCAQNMVAQPSLKVLRSEKTSDAQSCDYLRLLAGRRILDVELSHVANDGEVAVVEHQRPRNAVLVELETDRIDRRL